MYINIRGNALSITLNQGENHDDPYFDKAFEPILVTGDDGNEYDQFK